MQMSRWEAANKKHPVFRGSLFATLPWRCNYPTESDQNPCSRRLIFHENRPSRNSTLGIGKLDVLQVIVYSKHSSLAGLNMTNSNIRMKKGGTIETIWWNEGCPPKNNLWNPSSVCLFQTKVFTFWNYQKSLRKTSVSRQNTHWSSLNPSIRPGWKNPNKTTKKKTNQRPTNPKSPPSMPKSPRTSSFTCQCGWLWLDDGQLCCFFSENSQWSDWYKTQKQTKLCEFPTDSPCSFVCFVFW